ncbi:MAG: DUF1016 domain-containing protein [Algicola sp.]|nr:DUF1016 domain-containing protein [Algicola sp.]
MNKALINTGLLTQIRKVLTQARHQLQQTVNDAMVQCYWQIGQLLVNEEQQGRERVEYGKQQLQQVSEKLTVEFGKGFTVRNLRNMRAFYLAFPIRHAVRAELTWTHYRTLIRVENQQARDWYMLEAIEQHWSARALDRQISVLYYERLLSSKDKAATTHEAAQKTTPLKTNPRDFLRDPYILDFLNLPSQLALESELEQALIDNLQLFLLELGKGFAFVARQQRVKTPDQDFYLDLVFYNFKLKCFLLIDLKLGLLTHQDVGQMDTYVRIYDQHEKDDDDNPTIGLILCSEKTETIAKYSALADGKQLFASRYLPSEAELIQQLEKERALLVADALDKLNDEE